MGHEIMAAAESIAAVLKDRGFDKEAAVVNEAALGMGQGVGKWSPTMMQPEIHRTEPQDVAPKEPGQQFAEKGELITVLNPSSGKEEIILWGIQKPFTIDELNEAVKNGYLAVDYFNEQYQKATDPKTKEFFKDMRTKADAFRKHQAIGKLASLGSKLTEKGYETLGRRLFEAAGRLQVA